MHQLDYPEATSLEAMDAAGDGLAKRPRLGAVLLNREDVGVVNSYLAASPDGCRNAPIVVSRGLRIARSPTHD